MIELMEYRNLGNTDMKVSVLGLGTVALGMNYGITPITEEGSQDKQSGMTPPTDTEAIRLVHYALDQGVNFIDTARAYGRSEEILGKALHDRRDRVILATKLGCYDANGQLLSGDALRQHMEDSIITSLRLLQTDYIDQLMLHSAPVDLLKNGEVIGILRDFQQRGLTRTIGASTYGTEAPKAAIAQGVDALQVAYNILDQRMADEIFPLAQSREIAVVVRSVFLKGALTSRADDLPASLNELKVKSETIKQFSTGLAPSHTRVQAALRFVLSQANVSTALVGVTSITELNASLEVAHLGPFTADVLAQFEQLRWDDKPDMLNPGTWGIP